MYNGQFQNFKQWKSFKLMQDQQAINAINSVGYMNYNRMNNQMNNQDGYASVGRLYGALPPAAQRPNHITNYNPDPNLAAYNGPYPVKELQKARNSLIDSLKNDTSDILQRIKPRLGITSCYGVAYKLPEAINLKEDSTLSRVDSSCSVDSSVSLESSASLDSSGHALSSRVSTTSTSSNSPNNKSSAKSTSLNHNSQIHSKDSSNESSQERSSLKRKSDSTTSDTETPTKKVHSDSMVDVTTPQQIFKCDFCNYQGSTKSVIEFHLSSAKHFSASLYTTQGSKLVAVEKKLAVKRKCVKNQALVVVCPMCHDLFEDIFMCGMHYKYAHGGNSNNGFYAVTPVIHTENVMVYQEPKCQKCAVAFEKQRNLHKHWIDNPKHHPLTKCLHPNAFAIYACVYCSKTFRGDFLSCKCHVLGHKDGAGNERAVCAVKVTHIMKPGRGEELLPPSDTSIIDGLEDEVKTLRNMITHFNGMSGTKSKVEMCQKRIKFLAQFREANGKKPQNKTHS